jgi:hypothetical protein
VTNISLYKRGSERQIFRVLIQAVKAGSGLLVGSRNAAAACPVTCNCDFSGVFHFRGAELQPFIFIFKKRKLKLGSIIK